MKTFAKLFLTSLLLIMAVPAYSDTDAQVIQIFICEFNDDATSDQLLDMTAEWLKAARAMDGGENIQVGIRFPIAEGPAAEGDFRFIIVTPTFTDWGKFTDAYEGSGVAEVDNRLNVLADCGQSTIWEGLMVK